MDLNLSKVLMDGLLPMFAIDFGNVVRDSIFAIPRELQDIVHVDACSCIYARMILFVCFAKERKKSFFLIKIVKFKADTIREYI